MRLHPPRSTRMKRSCPTRRSYDLGTVVGQRGHQRTAAQSGDPVNIGGASAATGVSQRMIRHYEKIGLIPSAARRDSGYRDYSDVDVHRLRFIANARDLGFPIEEIRKLLGLWSDRGRAS